MRKSAKFFSGWCLCSSPLIAFYIKWSYDWSITYNSLSEWQKMWIEASGVNFITVNAFIVFSILVLGGILAYIIEGETT